MKKEKENQTKKPLSDNARITIRVVAIALVIIAVFFATPFGRNLFNGKKTNTTTTPPVQSSGEADVSVSNGKTTSETVHTTKETSKYYNLLVNTADFTYVTKDEVTTVTAKDNAKIYMVVTPYTSKKYDDYCNELGKTYAEVNSKLGINNPNRMFRIQSGDKNSDTITTVHCINNGKKGIIEIKYVTTVAANKVYSEKFREMLNFFYIK